MLSGFFLMLSSTAQSYLIQPQIRVGTGISYTDGALGFSVSMDTKMTQIMYMSMGGFRSLEKPEIEFEDDDIDSWVALRHGIWAAPTFRFPHRYAKKGLNWDVLIHTGFGATFSDLANEEDWSLMEPAGMGGLDAIIFLNNICMKASGKMFVYGPYIPEFRQKALIIRPQVSLELAYKW